MVYRSNHVMTELGLSKYFVVLRFIFQTCTSLVVLRERERERRFVGCVYHGVTKHSTIYFEGNRGKQLFIVIFSFFFVRQNALTLSFGSLTAFVVQTQSATCILI